MNLLGSISVVLSVLSLVRVITGDETGLLVDYSCLHQDNWLVNKDGHYNFIFSSPTDVISASMNDLQFEVTSKGVPHYDRVFTSSDIDQLDSRPNAHEEFKFKKV